jgi:hypothetical protein
MAHGKAWRCALHPSKPEAQLSRNCFSRISPADTTNLIWHFRIDINSTTTTRETLQTCFRCALFGVALTLSLSPVVAQDISPTPTPPPIDVPSVRPAMNPPPGLAVASVTYPNGGSVVTHCQTGRFELVGAQPGDVLQVTVYYPTDQALQIVNLEALDGGMLLPPTVEPIEPPPLGCVGDGCPNQPTPALSLVINADGTISFTFVVGQDPGLRQISLRQGDQELGLQFWVNDPDNPDSNPPALSPQQ